MRNHGVIIQNCSMERVREPSASNESNALASPCRILFARHRQWIETEEKKRPTNHEQRIRNVPVQKLKVPYLRFFVSHFLSFQRSLTFSL
jgi:hypothetical protein